VLWLDIAALKMGFAENDRVGNSRSGQRNGTSFFDPNRPHVMLCIYNEDAVFDWDENNLRKIRAHRIKPEEVEQGLSNNPILIYE